jgi:small neutral amino acid transporter SnatA (MarC family)
MTVVALLLAVNPLRLRGSVPTRDRRITIVVAGAISMLVVLVVAWTSGPVLAWLGVSAATAEVAAGTVAAMAGLVHTFDRPPLVTETPAGWRGGIVPLAFPMILRPEVVLLALARGATAGVAATVGAGILAVAVGAAAAVSPRPHDPRIWRGLGRMAAALLVPVGVAIAVDGVFRV